MRTRKEIQRMKKRQRNKKAITNFVTALALCGVSTSLVSAEQWVAKTPDQIVIEQGATEYVMTWGDTIWAIGQKINVKTDVLLEVNELTYETACVIPVGRKIKLVQGEGNKVALEVTDKQGNVIGTRELKSEDKVDPTKDFGCDVETGEPTLKVTTDKNGNQTAVPNKNLKNPSKPSIKFQNGGNLTNDDKPSIDVNDIPEEKGNDNEGDNGNVGIAFEPSDNGNTGGNVTDPTEPSTEPSDNDNNGGNTVTEPTEPVNPPITSGVDIEAGNKGLWKRQMYIDAGATLGVITGDYEVDGDLGRYSSREEARNNAEIVLHSQYNDNLAWDYEDGKTTTPPVNGWYSEQGFGENTWKVLFR